MRTAVQLVGSSFYVKSVSEINFTPKRFIVYYQYLLTKIDFSGYNIEKERDEKSGDYIQGKYFEGAERIQPVVENRICE